MALSCFSSWTGSIGDASTPSRSGRFGRPAASSVRRLPGSPAVKAPGCAGSRGSADDAQLLVVLGEEIAISAVGTVAGAEGHDHADRPAAYEADSVGAEVERLVVACERLAPLRAQTQDPPDEVCLHRPPGRCTLNEHGSVRGPVDRAAVVRVDEVERPERV